MRKLPPGRKSASPNHSVARNLPLYPTPPVVEALAHRFYNQIIEGKLVDRAPGVSEPKNFETVDLDSVEVESEHATVDWLNDNSALCEPMGMEEDTSFYPQRRRGLFPENLRKGHQRSNVLGNLQYHPRNRGLVFRILKTDLEIRPVFHKTDENTMAHLFLAVLAYQLVSTIRYRLKAKGIHHNWSHIVRIMNTQKGATVTMQDKNDRKIYIRKCSKPETKAREIYDALGYKYQPWIRKSVLPEKQPQKTDNADCVEITS